MFTVLLEAKTVKTNPLFTAHTFNLLVTHCNALVTILMFLVVIYISMFFLLFYVDLQFFPFFSDLREEVASQWFLPVGVLFWFWSQYLPLINLCFHSLFVHFSSMMSISLYIYSIYLCPWLCGLPCSKSNLSLCIQVPLLLIQGP